MKRSISVLLSAVIFLGPIASAFAWGDDGHQTVGKIASLRIKQRTAQKIAQILKPGETLANISTWADTVKDRVGKTDPDDDTNAFLQDIAHNEKNREWQLIINNDRRNLHSFWDFDLLTSLMLQTDKRTSDTLGSFLKETVRPQSSWNPRGPVSTWAAQWATDTLQQSRDHAYKSVDITGQRTITVTTRAGQPVMREGRPVTDIVYDVKRSSNYETLNREVVRQQLAKGGYRLARLLDAIYSK